MPLDYFCLSTTAGVFVGSGGTFFSPCFGYEGPKRTLIEKDKKGGKAKALELLLTAKKDSLKRKQVYEHQLANLDHASFERRCSDLDTSASIADVAEKDTSTLEHSSSDSTSTSAEDSRIELALEGDREARTRELEEQAEMLLRENLRLKEQTQELENEVSSKDASIKDLQLQVQGMTNDKASLEERVQELENQNTDTPKPEKPESSTSHAEETEELRACTQKILTKETESERELANDVVATKTSSPTAVEVPLVSNVAKGPTLRTFTRLGSFGQSPVKGTHAASVAYVRAQGGTVIERPALARRSLENR